jgi:hypothetical protein
LAATGGIFVLIAFLLLIVFVAWRGVVALRSTTGINQIVVATFFGAWVTYEAQSLISIDNVGIAIWGWILGGIVVALSKPDVIDAVNAPVNARPLARKKNSASIKSGKPSGSGSLAQPLVSGLLFTLALGICIPMLLIDSTLKAANSYSPPTASNLQVYLQQIRKPLNYGIQDAHAKFSVAILLAQSNQFEESKSDLLAILNRDHRSFEAMSILALISEKHGNIADGAKYREDISQIDPYNYQNLLQLGEDLKNTGDKAGAKAILARINAFAPKTQEAATAQKDFGTL